MRPGWPCSCAQSNASLASAYAPVHRPLHQPSSAEVVREYESSWGEATSRALLSTRVSQSRASVYRSAQVRHSTKKATPASSSTSNSSAAVASSKSI